MKTYLLILAMASGAILSTPATAQSVIDLGTAASYGVLAGSAVTSTGVSIINGDLGVSPSPAVNGFAGYSSGGLGLVNGTIHAGDVAAAQAQSDLLAAYNMVSGQTATVTGVASFANTTLLPGVYHAAASLGLSGTLTLDGNGAANPVFIFQMGSTLLTANSSQIILLNGARAENVYWQVGSSATLGDSTLFAGSILAVTSITLGSDVTMEGQLLAMNGAVTMNGGTISVASSAIPEPAVTSLLLAAGAGLFIGLHRMRRRILV